MIKYKVVFLFMIVLVLVSVSKSDSLQKQKCLKKDSKFCKITSGPILDTSTKLMWASKDNGIDITWHDAKSYCKNYTEGGYDDWRMPTLDELETLYQPNRYYYIKRFDRDAHVTELILMTCPYPWASDWVETDATFYDFHNGWRFRIPAFDASRKRALPVRINN